jgi:hypothetical protein
MVTVQISVKQFAQAWGISPRAVQATLKRGNSYTPITRVSMVGNTYILTVNKEWYESKQQEQSK